MNAAGTVLSVAGLVIFFGGCIRWGMRITLADVTGMAVQSAGNALLGWWPMAAIGAALAAGLALCWWHDRHNRRRRNRAARSLSDEARALIADLVRKVRERPARPVLIPSPGGAS
jgi:glycerol kinase